MVDSLDEPRSNVQGGGHQWPLLFLVAYRIKSACKLQCEIYVSAGDVRLVIGVAWHVRECVTVYIGWDYVAFTTSNTVAGGITLRIQK